ncbi:MAG TPA: hypothetical protein VH374_20570 [Polyangia bacterium]|jgi:hypothetical protein|nr:hypothetical protein [Polyangia bacterium]
MTTPAVGEDIEALCGRCGQVWHVVMAKMGEKIAKVVCKRCGGHHLYRTENGEVAVSSGSGGESARRSAPRRMRRSSGPVAPLVVPAFDPSKPPRGYTAKEGFAAGERVTHPTFGTGVVTASPGPGKVEIAFPSGVRVLACAKATSTLERPHFAANVPISDRPPDKPGA